MSDIEIGSANRPAYEKQEVRTGPPLDYVGAKMRSSLESLRHAYGAAVGEFEEVGGRVRMAIAVAFKYELTAFLALFNLLTLAADHGLADRLLACSDDQFAAWIAMIETEGSVTG